MLCHVALLDKANNPITRLFLAYRGDLLFALAAAFAGKSAGVDKTLIQATIKLLPVAAGFVIKLGLFSIAANRQISAVFHCFPYQF